MCVSVPNDARQSRGMTINFERIKALAIAVSSITTAVALPLVGYWFTNALKEREIQGRFVELAVTILKEDPTPSNLGIRTWATQVINKYSGVSFDAKTTSELIDKTSLPQNSTNTHHTDQAALKSEYESLFNSLSVRKEGEVELLRIQTDIEKNKQRYTEVEKKTGVPWQVIAVLHYEEGALDFNTHLHNGDPLSERTVNPPSKRPRAGNPPFAWEDSAIDCLEYEDLKNWYDWSLAGILYKLEGFNGWSYRLHGINSPYLWAGSTHYTAGKVMADGTWSDSAVSKQLGAAVVLKALLAKHPIR